MDPDVKPQEKAEQPTTKPRLRRLNNLKKPVLPDTFSNTEHIYFINGVLKVSALLAASTIQASA
jgi:hypothetical protein